MQNRIREKYTFLLIAVQNRYVLLISGEHASASRQ